ncbi:MAG: hypothetical protein H6Q74_734 [Firmicutes bacterium]|nr:hypothetical protein [Bacillota bacterium]
MVIKNIKSCNYLQGALFAPLLFCMKEVGHAHNVKVSNKKEGDGNAVRPSFLGNEGVTGGA